MATDETFLVGFGRDLDLLIVIFVNLIIDFINLLGNGELLLFSRLAVVLGNGKSGIFRGSNSLSRIRSGII